METLLNAALVYAARGWPVLPLHSIDAGRCTCGNSKCDHPGKHPRTQHGLKDATTAELQIRLWWKRWPTANVGIRTGATARLVVLDLDARKGGLESARQLGLLTDAPPATLAVATGGGGLHLYLHHPGHCVKNSASSIAPGIDVRGDNGYVVAPPSMHSSGRAYAWRGDCPSEPAPLPPGLVDKPVPRGRRPAVQMVRCDNGQHWLDKALARASEGNRNETGLWLACQLRDSGVSASDTEAVMRQYAARCPAGTAPYT